MVTFMQKHQHLLGQAQEVRGWSPQQGLRLLQQLLQQQHLMLQPETLLPLMLQPEALLLLQVQLAAMPSDHQSPSR